MNRKRQLLRTIFIACEGKNTERIYFEAIGEETAVISLAACARRKVRDPILHELGL